MADINNITCTQSLHIKDSPDRAPRGEVRVNVSMKKHTSWHVGGRVERIFLPDDLEDLTKFR